MVPTKFHLLVVLSVLVVNTQGKKSCNPLATARKNGYNEGFEQGLALAQAKASTYRSGAKGVTVAAIQVVLSGVPKVDDPENTEEPEVMNMKNIKELQDFVEEANSGKGKPAIICKDLQAKKKPLVVRLENWNGTPEALKDAKQSYRFIFTGLALLGTAVAVALSH